MKWVDVKITIYENGKITILEDTIDKNNIEPVLEDLRKELLCKLK